MRLQECFFHVTVLFATSVPVMFAQAKTSAGPDCGGPNHWPASMTFSYLKNAGIINAYKIDFTKTTSIRISSQRIARDLYRQVYDIVYVEKAGSKIEAIAVADASSQECSMSGVTVYVVSRKLGPE